MFAPEIIEENGGKYMRRDVFIEYMADEIDELTVKKAETLLDDMIDDGPMMSMTRHGEEYVALTSKTQANLFMAKGKAISQVNQTKERINDLLGF